MFVPLPGVVELGIFDFIPLTTDPITDPTDEAKDANGAVASFIALAEAAN